MSKVESMDILQFRFFKITTNPFTLFFFAPNPLPLLAPFGFVVFVRRSFCWSCCSFQRFSLHRNFSIAVFPQWTNYFQHRIKWNSAQFPANDRLFVRKMFRFVWNMLALTHSIRIEHIRAASKKHFINIHQERVFFILSLSLSIIDRSAESMADVKMNEKKKQTNNQMKVYTSTLSFIQKQTCTKY